MSLFLNIDEVGRPVDALLAGPFMMDAQGNGASDPILKRTPALLKREMALVRSEVPLSL